MPRKIAQSVRLSQMGAYVVAPLSYAVAELYSGATVASCYTGLNGEFVWDTGMIPDAGTVIELTSDFYVIDAVDLGDHPATRGANPPSQGAHKRSSGTGTSDNARSLRRWLAHLFLCIFLSVTYCHGWFTMSARSLG